VTRLTLHDLAGIPAGLSAYDAELESRTGCTLRALACRATGLGERGVCETGRGRARGGGPPGLRPGVLPGFAEAVRAVAAHLGFEAWVTARPDAGGLAEAYWDGARVLVTADEESFIAVNLVSRRVADNNEATARGFVTALELLVGEPGEGREARPGQRGGGVRATGGPEGVGGGPGGAGWLAGRCSCWAAGPWGARPHRCLLERARG